MPVSTRSALIAAVSTVGVLAVAVTVAQQAPEPIGRWLSDYPGPAIDRGLRDQDPPRPPRSAGVTYVPGSIVVKFRAGTSATARRSMAALVDGDMTPAMSNANFDVLRFEDGADAERVAARLSQQPDVEYAQARYLVRPLYVPNDPLYFRQWNFPAIDMERAWDINTGGSPSITVAVLDTGVAYRSGLLRHNAIAWTDENGRRFPALGVLDIPFAAAPDLAGPDRFVAPRDFIWGDVLPFDLDGHGTHVAGTLGQLTNNNVGAAGMAFNVRIMPVKVIDGVWDLVFNSPFVGTDDTVARGVRYAVDNGAKVLNMSIGRSGPPAPVVEDAIRYAVSRGAFVAVAGGNEFLRGPAPQRLAEFAPAVDGMVAVGAVGQDKLRAAYSSIGSFIELMAPGGDFTRPAPAGIVPGILQQTLDLDLVETFAAGPGSRYRAPRFDSFQYFYFTGTSMATPHVAGFAAMLMQQGITSPAAVEAIMKQFATDLGPAGRDDEYGHGLINPRAALRGMGLAK
jgi:serine protease